MDRLRIYRYQWGTLMRIMDDLTGFTNFDEFVSAIERRMKLHDRAWRDIEQYLIVDHKTTTLRSSRILAHAKWNGKEKKLEITKV